MRSTSNGGDGSAWYETVTVEQLPGTSHVDNVQIFKLLNDAWQRFLREGIDLPYEHVWSPEARPIVKSVSAQFNTELFGGDSAVITVKAAGRSNRSFTLAQHIWTTDPHRPAVVGSVVLVTIDRTGTPVSVPNRLWDALERAGTQPQ